MSDLPIARCTEADFLQIMGSLDQFWDDARDYLHNRLFLNEFGDSAYVIRDGRLVAAYLFGFIGTSEPRTGYVHLVAVRDSYRGRGLARRMYEKFEDYARNQGCSQLKAVTSARQRSLGRLSQERRHGCAGGEALRGPKEEHHRVVFRKSI
jgi:GNAT superfamily N-acetyltransferase